MNLDCDTSEELYPAQDTLLHVKSKHGRKWTDRRQEKHCRFSLSGMNTQQESTTQTWISLKLNSNVFQSYPEKKQQLVDQEKDADNIKKVLSCKSCIYLVVLKVKFVFL